MYPRRPRVSQQVVRTVASENYNFFATISTIMASTDCTHGRVRTYIFDSPIGDIHIASCPEGLHSVCQSMEITDENFKPDKTKTVILKSGDPEITYTAVKEATHWLKTYFKNPQNILPSDIPQICNTCVRERFKDKVWISLAKNVQPGQAISYGELAKLVGSPNAAQAVGTALRKNPLQLIIPCHRVICSGGNFGNYAGGRRNNVKHWLLHHEGFTY